MSIINSFNVFFPAVMADIFLFCVYYVFTGENGYRFYFHKYLNYKDIATVKFCALRI